MRVGIDLDGVCHDLIGSYRRFLHWTRNHPHATPEPTEWDFCDSWGVSRERFLLDLREHADDIFDGEILPGTREALLDLHDAGHDIHFITHRPLEAWTVTQRWLDRHGLRYIGELHFVVHKHEVPVDIHLDDHLDTAVAMAGAGVRSCLFDRPWNRAPHALGVHRVQTWGRFLDLVRREAEARAIYDERERHPLLTITPTNGERPPMRTNEQNEILGIFLDLLAAPTGDGGTKRARGEKPNWKVDPGHLAAAYRHLDPSRERYDEDSGTHRLVHAAWRLLAVAYQDMVADGRVPGDPA